MVYLPLTLIIVAHIYLAWLITQAYEATNIKRRRRKRR